MKKYQYETVVKMTIAALIALVFIIYYTGYNTTIQELNTDTPVMVEMEVPPIVVDIPPAYKVSDKELVCLAMTINGEARDQPISGQIKVAEVIMNRLDHGHWGDDVCEVVHYVNDGVYHFTTWDPRDPNLKHIKTAFGAEEFSKATLTSIWAADYVLTNGVQFLPEDSYNYATFRVNNHWTRRLKFVERDGDHVFRRGF